MPKNVLPRAMVWGGVADDPVYVDAANPVPVGGPALDLIDADLDTLNAQMASLVSAATAPVTDMPHDALDALLDLEIVPFDVSASGSNTIMAAVSAKTIRVHGLVLTAASACVLTAMGVVTKTGATGNLPLLVNGPGAILDISGRPWFTLPTNTAFILSNSAAVRIAGWAYVVQA